MFQLLLWLLGGHLVGDFAWQGDDVAEGKVSRPLSRVHKTVPWYLWLLSHAAMHGFIVSQITESPSLGMAEFVTHAAVDFAKPWYTPVEAIGGWPKDKRKAFWLDQALHVACKVTWAVLATT